ncbi:TadE/TadG family type IV pilus assembly protein [Emcibacter sp. SYSU 3D8]|uniref:TadE/TadG family type IV pilus assembly protein n=1 Tax=Emcibacter sp. SYSU 3D8 TaxID=3133969 RepID=UPI0031FEB710
MRGLRRFFGDDTGASAVEFALVVVPLLLFIFGTVEFSRLMWTRQSMQSLAIEAARCMGILQPQCISGTTYNAANTRNYVISRAGKLGVPLTSSDIALNNSDSCKSVSGFSTVTITYTFSSVAPRLVTALTGSTNLSASACFPNNV